MISTISVKKHEHDDKEYIVLTGTASEIRSVRDEITRGVSSIILGDMTHKYLFLGLNVILAAEEIWCINFNINEEK